MAETPHRPEPSDIPSAVAAPKSRRTVQLVWLIPLVAALVGGWLAVKSVLDRGPVITISFKSAEGLEAGKTKLKYKDVEVGLVNSVALSPDLSRVIVTAEMGKSAGPHLVEDTRFWVVRPRVSGGSVSGLGTLLGGSYIGVDIGTSTREIRDFTGLETPPVFTSNAPGREFVLRSENIGSLDYGSPVFFRRLQVGQVAAYELNKDGSGVTLKIFVNAPYDQYVNANTRFWEASGIDFKLDASGVEINTQSLVSIAIGGIAFQTPATSAVLPPAEPNSAFNLFNNRAEAMKRPDSIIDTYVMVFNESLRGLAPGAPVDFRGIVVGEVVSVNTYIDPVTTVLSFPVEINIYPERFSSRSLTGSKSGRMFKDRKVAIDILTARGLRAQLRTGNLLTGQLYIALDFFPDAPKTKVDWAKKPPELPTVAGTAEDLRAAVGSIARKLDKMDFEAIGANLQETLKSTNKLIQRLDTELAPEAHAMMEEARRAMASVERSVEAKSPLQQDTREALREIARAAQAFRNLADYLEQHPEALLRGKKEDAK
jgi:paraquat-inducible protein B